MAAAMRPVIGYTIEFEDPLLRKVEVGLREPLQRFGALPVVLPRETPEELLDELLDMIDGVQLCGGADVHPKRYGAETHPLTKPFRDEQDEFEIELVRRAFAPAYAVGAVLAAILVGVRLLAEPSGLAAVGLLAVAGVLASWAGFYLLVFDEGERGLVKSLLRPVRDQPSEGEG